MSLSNVNWLAVIVCVLLNVAAGFIWYHPRVFFNIWWQGIGRRADESPAPSPTLYVWTLLAAFVEAIFVSLLLNAMESTTLASGLQAGLMIWLGFVATTNLVNNLFAGRGWTVWAVEAGNHLVYLLLTGAILSVWR